MTAQLLILISGVLLLAYLLDLSAKFTRIPTVIWLLAMGWGLQQFTQFAHIKVPNLNGILPVFGTIGLILIVLESALDLHTLPWSVGMVALLFSLRFLFLLLTRQNLSPYLFVAPRGLITILLYLSIPVSLQLKTVNQALIIQVILCSILVMMLGLIFHKEPVQNTPPHDTH